MRRPVIRSLIPSYRPERQSLVSLVDALTAASANPVVLANGGAALRTAEAAELAVLAPGTNAGFGPSIRWAVERLDDWDWLLLANDDLEIDGRALSEALRTVGPGTAPELVHLDEDIERPIPSVLDVLANVSLLARALERARPPRVPHRGGYRSFSCVLISRAAWDLTGGFDPRLPFTYEDADLTRRLLRAGGTARVLPGAGVVHHRSTTSSRAVADVLPIATWSALRYLRKWWSPRGGTAPLLVAIALVTRLPLVPFGQADRRAHVAGIRRALDAVLRGRAPSMPPYEPVTR